MVIFFPDNDPPGDYAKAQERKAEYYLNILKNMIINKPQTESNYDFYLKYIYFR